MSNGNTQSALARLAGLHTSTPHTIISPSCSSLSRSLTFSSDSESLSLRQSVSKSSNYTVVEPDGKSLVDTPRHPDDHPKDKRSKKENKPTNDSSTARKYKKRRKSRRILHLYTPSSRSPSPNLSGSESHSHTEGGPHFEKQQLEVLLEERMRSWTRKELEMSNPIPKSLTKMRTVIHQQQIDFNQRLAPHCSRLNKWNEDISYLDNKFTGYAELNQLKEAILDSEGNNTEEHKLDPIDHRTKLNKTKSNSFNKMVNTKKTRDTASKSVLKPQLKSKQKSKSKTKAYSKRASVSVTTSVLTPGTTPSTRLNRSDAVIHKDLDDDDGYYELDAEILLRQYLNCSNLVAAQRARAETVDEYIVPLNERKTRLRRIVRQYESDIGSMQSKHDKLDSKYRALTEKRSSIQDQIDKLVTTLNATIEEENETMRTAVQTKNDLNVLKLEKKGYEILLQTSRSLSSSYQRYLKDIQSASHKLNVYFVKRWEEHEARWPKWSGDDVLNWLRCLNETECPNKIQLSSTINLNVVKQGIKRHGICGSTLDQMDRNDWIHVGVQLLEDRIQIHERIQSMVHKFPRPKLVKKQSMSLSHRSHVHVCGPGGTGPMMMDCEVVAVPEEFKCPITGEIMHHPVRCADNKLYDRQNVICYLRKYGHLPGSTERAGYADGDGMDNIEMTDCLKMKRAIEAFLAEHPQIEYID